MDEGNATMDHSIFFRKATGELVEWKRTRIRNPAAEKNTDGKLH